MRHPHRRDFLHQSTAAGLALSAAGGFAVPAEPDRLRVVVLEGTAHERGLTHGKTLKEPIHALVKLWKADLAERYKMEADAFIPKFLRYTDYLPAIRQWTPDLLEEIRGIAQGAAIDFDTMLVFQLIDEYWVNGPGAAGEHCSALGISRQGDRPAYVAQNMDLEGFRDGFQTVLHIKHADAKRETLVLTHAGLIGLNGVNNRSIGICCNTLTQLANGKDGLPVACVVRGALEQPSDEAAIGFLRKVKHASGQNYILGGPSKVYSFECSAGKVAPFTPATGADMLWHTNHPLANDDYTAKYREELEKKKGAAGQPGNSEVRLQSVEKRLRAAGKAGGLDLIRTILTAKDSAEHPVCRAFKNKKDSFTFASTIMVLAEKPEMHITPGPPDGQRYQTLAFDGGR